MNDKMELNEENRGKGAKIRVCPHCGASKQRRYAGGVPLNRSKPRGSRPCGASRNKEGTAHFPGTEGKMSRTAFIWK